MFRLTVLITIGFAVSVLGWIKVPDNYPGRIIGGEDAVPNQFPYQASLRDADMFHFCGGTIINNCYILSAAHCDPNADATKFVVLGSIFRSNVDVIHDVIRVINHPSYNPATVENDISLMRVSPYITYTAAVQPMPIAAHAAQSGDAVISGWGRLETDGESPEILQFLNTQIISDEQCDEEINVNNFIVSNTTICIRNPVGQGMCQGDSGGPLVHNGGLHGVASWMVPNCGSDNPDVYTRVSAYVSWILANAV